MEKNVFVHGYLGFGSPKGGEAYWKGEYSGFVSGTKKFFNDNNTYFLDYECDLKNLILIAICAGIRDINLLKRIMKS